MHFLIAPDKFKDAITARQAAQCIEQGMREALPQATTTLLPLADGGEGSCELLTRYMNGELRTAAVADPLFRTIEAKFGLAGEYGIIEMAQASGLHLLKAEERNCAETTSLGTGQLMLEAIKAGAKKLLIAIGGSATCDGGIGMAHALGYRFLNRSGESLLPIGKNLLKIEAINTKNLSPALSKVKTEVACDVTNPLFGQNGAAKAYGPQKGASGIEIEQLNEGLKNLNRLFIDHFKKDCSHIAGSGAAGGMGAGLLCFAGAELKAGSKLLLKYSNFEKYLASADYIITGEGRFDSQSLSGKLTGTLIGKAASHRLPVAVFCGAAEPFESEKLQSSAKIIVITPTDSKLPSALRETAQNLESAAYNFAKRL